MIHEKQAALVMIDMQNGFISPDSSLCVAGARATVPACARALQAARSKGMAVYHVRRVYAEDGSDVEPVRYRTWIEGGKPLCETGNDPSLVDAPAELEPAGDETVIVKPRFSALFATNLDMLLREAGISTLVLIGTTTPNCIRSTCYDALSLNYNVVIIEDCTSSRTPEVQRANIEDMAFIGAHVMDCDTFCRDGLANAPDVAGEFAEAVRTFQEGR